MKKEVYINNSDLHSKLNNLLSDYQIYYQNLRAFHWLIKGPQFYQLHSKFEEFYTQAADNIDEVAERILMTGGVPLHSFEDYLATASINPAKGFTKSADILLVVIENLEFLLGSFREILEAAGDVNDEGTSALMSDFISATEKQLWMLNSLNE